ncbi:MAG: ferritin-like domain-containing protein [Alphaproteobacteria bacterium]|nr:ferritin-like domain-containing protein [Alphaproteobacteria bacterium]
MAKARMAGAAASAWTSGSVPVGAPVPAPARPGRPERPELLAPSRMPKRRVGGQAGRVALLHAVAHIELNAIDLAWDMVLRFGIGDGLPRAFLDDWVRVGADEARHFELLAGRLAALGARYGDLPAHDGLWSAAAATADDVKARLAVVPLVLEARGLDVTPGMIERLRAAGDDASAAALDVIYAEEVGHVAAGMRWFAWACARDGLPPRDTWQALVGARMRGGLKRPFNAAARSAAGLAASYYEPLA